MQRIDHYLAVANSYLESGDDKDKLDLNQFEIVDEKN